MELIPILSTVVLIAIMVTLVLAFASYIVYRLRDIRKRRAEGRTKTTGNDGPKYFEKHIPRKSSDLDK